MTFSLTYFTPVSWRKSENSVNTAQRVISRDNCDFFKFFDMLDNSVTSTKKIVLSIWLMCWIALLLCMLLCRKFMIAFFWTFYFLFLIFLIGWEKLWYFVHLCRVKLSFCSQRDIHNTCSFRFCSPKYISFNQSYAFILLFWVFLFIYSLAYLFFEATVLSQNRRIFTCLA